MATLPVDGDYPVHLLARAPAPPYAGEGPHELRITPSVWPSWRRVVHSTREFSGSRLRNSGPHPDQIR